MTAPHGGTSGGDAQKLGSNTAVGDVFVCTGSCDLQLAGAGGDPRDNGAERRQRRTSQGLQGFAF